MHSIQRLTLLTTVSILGMIVSSGLAQAGCAPAASAGDDTLTCDASAPDPTIAAVDLQTGTDQITVTGGTYSGGITGGAGAKTVNLLGGSVASYANTAGTTVLTFTSGSTANVTGNVTTGAGNDRFEMQSGTVGGFVDQGDGVNSFVISGGRVVGAVSQGTGIDDFRMTGGRIASLNQGEGYDTFFMSGGVIDGGFDDGDYAEMSGGTIGRVNMKLADNVFIMTGGTIRNNLVTGLGRDRITISNGTIGGNISVSSGVDIVTITGGSIAGDVTMGFGNDVFTWDGGGTIGGNIELEGDNDTATLRDLTAANLGNTKLIDGGAGNDTITLGGSKQQSALNASLVKNFEHLVKTDAGTWTLSGSLIGLEDAVVRQGTLALGDAAVLGGGVISVDAGATLGGYGKVVGPVTNNGTIAVADAVAVFAGGAQGSFTIEGTLTNAGLARVGGAGVGNNLVVSNYVGQNGTIALNTALGTDGSPSDLLVIDGGSATGSSGLRITNVGGAGGLTQGDGILIVDTVNGGTTNTNAFSLAGPVAAGAYEYLLYRGGLDEETDKWYLRNTIEVVPDNPGPGAEPVVVPLYRPEASLYAAIPAMVRELGLATLGTFHERQGEQSLLDGAGRVPAGWARVFGEKTDRRGSGTVDPEFDGTIWGFQTGLDVYAVERPSGHEDRLGLFFGYAKADGDGRGFALATERLAVGKLSLDGYSLGGYWTHIGPSGWYLDSVVMNTWLDGGPRSINDAGADIGGTAFTASVEGGYPIALGKGLTFEPQAQMIWQNLSIDDTRDSFSTVSFGNSDAFTGRVGARLQGAYDTGSAMLKPYLKVNLWHDFAETDDVSLDSDLISTDFGGTSLEVGGGLVAEINPAFSIYATGGYTTDVGGAYERSINGNLGLRLTW